MPGWITPLPIYGVWPPLRPDDRHLPQRHRLSFGFHLRDLGECLLFPHFALALVDLADLLGPRGHHLLVLPSELDEKAFRSFREEGPKEIPAA